MKKNKSLVQDGGKLQPMKLTEVRKADQSNFSISSNRQPSEVKNYSNRSRLIVRDNADGTTDMIKTKQMKAPNTLRNSKASLDTKIGKGLLKS